MKLTQDNLKIFIADNSCTLQGVTHHALQNIELLQTLGHICSTQRAKILSLTEKELEDALKICREISRAEKALQLD